MPPKKAAAVAAAPPSPADQDQGSEPEAAAPRKIPLHPSTAVMVKEALKDLDSHKGVSSQAIQTFIRIKYPSVDPLRLRSLVRRTLKKGLESGTLVRPAKSTAPVGATGKFRLAANVKKSKPRGENLDPNVQDAAAEKKKKKKVAPKAAAKERGATEEEEEEEEPPQEETKPAKKSKKNQEPAPAAKVKAAKKPKASKDKPPPTKSKETSKETKTKETKAGKATKAAKAAPSSDGDAPGAKVSGKRGRKAAE